MTAVTESDGELKAVMQKALTYSNSFVRVNQAKMRDFISQTGQQRQYFREQNYGRVSYHANQFLQSELCLHKIFCYVARFGLLGILGGRPLVAPTKVTIELTLKNNGRVAQLTKSEKYDSIKAREELKKSIIKYVKNGTDKEIDKAIKNFICKKELFIYETT